MSEHNKIGVEKKKYLIIKYYNKKGEKRYKIATYFRLLFIKGHYCLDRKLKGLYTIEQAKEVIYKRGY